MEQRCKWRLSVLRPHPFTIVKHLNLADDLARGFSEVADRGALHSMMTHVAKCLGFRHFVLSYDKRSRHRQTTLFIHDLPPAWTGARESLVLRDLIRRAGERSVTGFHWRNLENLVPLTRGERLLLATGKAIGVSDGYSISRHLPGEASGCCSFAAPVGVPLTRNILLFADLAGTLAIAAARRIAGASGGAPDPVLSDRQRECVLWWARGKTASEIAVILGIAEFTAAQHLKMARERYNVPCRQMLILCAMFDGLIGFSDICDWWPSEKPL